MNENQSLYHPFPTTRWSLILEAKEGNSGQRKKAIEDLCHLYWLPLYAFARKNGNSPPDAEDATQDFLISFLNRSDFDRTDQSAGKMRSYLLAAFTNFLRNEHRNQHRLKRGGGLPIVSLQMLETENRYDALPSEDSSPEIIFDRAWAHELLEFVLRQLGASYCEREKEAEFEILHPFLTPTGDEPSHREIAQQLGVEIGAVKTMIHRMRREYRKVLRATIEDTLADDADTDEEIRALIAILRQK